MASSHEHELIELSEHDDLWQSCFLVAPLVVVGSLSEDGALDFAPKHMAMPLGWDRYFGFVCTPRHTTYRNIRRTEHFTVSFPRPDQVLLAGLAAAPREEDDTKPSLAALPTIPAKVVDGAFLAGSSLCLECRLDRIVDGFGDNSLITGKVVAARVAAESLRVSDGDEQELLARSPLLAYLHPGRFASVGETLSFPFPAGFKR